jgi:polyhydroxyalkanoate synthase
VPISQHDADAFEVGRNLAIVNPPTRAKYGYRTSRRTPANADEWLAEARQHDGSWWPHWSQWLAALGDEQVAARSVGSRQFPPLMDAPGPYVLAA